MTKSYLQNHRSVLAGNLLPPGPSDSRRCGPAGLCYIVFRVPALTEEPVGVTTHRKMGFNIATRRSVPGLRVARGLKREDEFLWNMLVH